MVDGLILLILVTKDVSRIVFEGRILRNIWGNPYLNSTNVLSKALYINEWALIIQTFRLSEHT